MNEKFELLIMGHQFKKLYEKYYDKLMLAYDLKKIDIDVLYFLSRSGTCDTARDIASLMYVSKAHVSKSIENLHLKDLIELVGDSSDRRYVHIRISKKGEPVIEEIKRIKKHASSILYDGITNEERQVLVKIANKIADNINTELEKGEH